MRLVFCHVQGVISIGLIQIATLAPLVVVTYMQCLFVQPETWLAMKYVFDAQMENMATDAVASVYCGI